MKTVELRQGSLEWHAHRATRRNASDAPVIMGLSPYKTRSAFLHELKTGIAPEVDPRTQARFDDGHRCEALARPIAEEVMGEDLYPVVGEEGPYSASFDGLNLMGDKSWEHKRMCLALRQAMTPGATGADLPEMYRVQLEHQCLVSGAERVLFTASEWDANSRPLDIRHVWYTPDPVLRARLIAAWDQFDADLAAYVPTAAPEKAVAEPIKALPALSIQLRGEVTASNLPAFKAAAETFIAAIVTDLKTDADFAQAAETVKFCEDAENRLELAKTQALEQTASVAELLRTVDHIKEQLRAKRLDLSKKVTSRKDEIKAEVIAHARSAYAAHLAGLHAEIEPVTLVLTAPDFAGAAKGKRTLATLQDAVDGELAAAKIAASQAAQAMREKLRWFRETAAEVAFLFADIQQLAQKPADDFRLAVQSRIDAHAAKQAEEAQRRSEAERLAAEAMAKASAIPAPTPVAAPAPVAATTGALWVVPAPLSLVRTADEPAVLNFGDLMGWLSLPRTVADVIEKLGIEPAAKQGATNRYTLAQAEAVRQGLIRHLQSLAPLRAAA